MHAVAAALLPVFLLIVTGVLLRRFLLRDEEHWRAVEQLVYYVLFPALLVESLASADLRGVPVIGVGGALALAVLVMTAICLALRPLLAKQWQVDGPAFTSVFQGATRWQTFVALAVAARLYGDAGVALASVAMVAMIPLLNAINVWVLAHFAGPRGTLAQVIAAVARNPFIWSCVAGVVINVTAVPVPAVLHTFVDMLGAASLPMGLLMVGAGLRVDGVLRPQAVTLLTTTLKLAVMPAIAVALATLFGLRGVNRAVVACCAAVPAASNAYVLARQMGGDAPLMAQILTIQTLVAMVTMPIAIALAQE